VLLIVVCDPIGALCVAGVLTEGADRATSRRFAVVSSGGAFAALAFAALAADRVLELLDMSVGGVTLAAAVVLVVPGGWLLARGDRNVLAHGTGSASLWGALVPVAFPVLAGPGAVLLAMSLAVTRGTGAAITGAAVVALTAGGLIATGAAAPVMRYPTLLNRVGGRVVGAAILVISLALAAEGTLGR